MGGGIQWEDGGGGSSGGGGGGNILVEAPAAPSLLVHSLFCLQPGRVVTLVEDPEVGTLSCLSVALQLRPA